MLSPVRISQQLATTVAAASEEASTNAQSVAQGTQQVSANIHDIQRGAGEPGSASLQVLSAAQKLSGDSNSLKSRCRNSSIQFALPDSRVGSN